jgi:hypothetical protein
MSVLPFAFQLYRTASAHKISEKMASPAIRCDSGQKISVEM